MWKHLKRLLTRTGHIVLLIGAILAAILLFLDSKWSRLNIVPDAAERYMDQLDDPGFYIAIGLAIVIVIIGVVLRCTQGHR